MRYMQQDGDLLWLRGGGALKGLARHWQYQLLRNLRVERGMTCHICAQATGCLWHYPYSYRRPRRKHCPSFMSRAEIAWALDLMSTLYVCMYVCMYVCKIYLRLPLVCASWLPLACWSESSSAVWSVHWRPAGVNKRWHRPSSAITSAPWKKQKNKYIQ